MGKYFVGAILLLLAGLVIAEEDNPYRSALQAESYEIEAAVLESARIGSVTLREEPELVARVHVRIRNYLPRALEPTLLINGEKTGYSIGVVDVEDDVTTVGFVVPQHALLQDGAKIAVQMGDDEETRSSLERPVSRSAIKPLDENAAKDFGLPRQLP